MARYGLDCKKKHFLRKMVERLKRDAVNRQVIQRPFRQLAVRTTASLTLCEGTFIGLLVFWWVHVITWGAAPYRRSAAPAHADDAKNNSKSGVP